MTSPYASTIGSIDRSSIVSKTYIKMGLAVLCSSVCASLAVKMQYFMSLSVMLIGILVLCVANVYIAKKIDSMPSAAVYGLLFAEAAFMGFMLGGSLQYYAPNMIALAFGVAVALYGVMAIVGWTTKKDLTRLGPILFSAVIVLILVEIILLFLNAPLLWMICSAVSIVLFSLYTAYDMQKLKYIQDDGSEMSGKLSTLMALSLYLDFVNIFINVLSLLGGGSRN